MLYEVITYLQAVHIDVTGSDYTLDEVAEPKRNFGTFPKTHGNRNDPGFRY